MEQVNMVDLQVLFNMSVGALGGIFGWLLNSIWQEIKTLQQNERKTSKEIAEINVLVAGNYVTKAEWNGAISNMQHTLERIENKLDKKQDK